MSDKQYKFLAYDIYLSNGEIMIFLTKKPLHYWLREWKNSFFIYLPYADAKDVRLACGYYLNPQHIIKIIQIPDIDRCTTYNYTSLIGSPFNFPDSKMIGELMKTPEYEGWITQTYPPEHEDFTFLMSK